MATLLCNCNTEKPVLLWKLFCQLTFNCTEDENQHVIDTIFRETCTVLLKDTETWVKPYLLHILTKHKHNPRFQEITSTVFLDESLKKQFNLICYEGRYKSSEWKEQLLSGIDFKYTHKCRRILSEDYVAGVIQGTESNFDLGCFLFDDEIEEPSRKKVKLDITETESLIESLENNTLLLSRVDRQTVNNYTQRIIDVIDKLKKLTS